MKKKRKKGKRKSYTIMIIPDDNGKTSVIRLNIFFIRAFIFCLIIASASVVFLFIRSEKLGDKLRLTSLLIKENKKLSEEKQDLLKITQGIESITELSNYLKRVAVSVGENNIQIPISNNSRAQKERIIDSDSLDTFIDKERSNKLEIYREFIASSASREELLLAIPNISPVEGWITKKYQKSNTNTQENHLGIDFAAKEGTLIRATAPGIVKTVVNDKYLGLVLSVSHKFGFLTRYGHCKQILVSQGDHVERGQTIALVGNTGRSSAPHVHYEILKNNKHIDPIKYIFDRLD